MHTKPLTHGHTNTKGVRQNDAITNTRLERYLKTLMQVGKYIY